MTNEKLKPLSDDELLNACRTQADTSTAFLDTKMAQERREVTEYYLGQKPYPMREGGSKFVSQDVYVSVENMKAELVETFGAGSQIVQFAPQGDGDVDQAKHATAYAEMAVHRQNDGLLIFQDIVHDGLTARVGIAKVVWEGRPEVTGVYRFNNAPLATVQQAVAAGNIRITSKPKIVQTGAEGPLVTVEYETVEDQSQVGIETVPPEEFIMKGRTRSLAKCRYMAHRYRTTLGELVEDGHDRDKVYAITGLDDDLVLDEEAMQREQDTATGFMSDDDAVDEAGRMVTCYESYIRIDALGLGTAQLWKVVHVGDTLLEKQRVNDHPFVAYVPQPLPHRFLGNNFAARAINHANTKTTLTRAIIEQAVDATNPRWQVARGGVANPRELIDNRRGGIVNVRSVSDSVAPLTGAPINPFVLQTIQMVDADREDTTGISRLSQGLDKKALSHQNSQGLVEGLADASKTRTKVIARNFALQFVTQLYLKVYKLALENESADVMLEVGGKFVPVQPGTWPIRRHLKVDMTLGYGERDQRVAEMADLAKTLEGSQKMGRSFGEKQAYNLWRDTLEIKGIHNMADYIVDPDTLGPAQQDPREAAEIAKLQAETDVLGRQQTLREHQVQAQIDREKAEHMWKVLTGKSEMQLKVQEQSRKDRETDNRIDIGLAELELAVWTETHAPPENVKLTAIASPNS